MQRSVGSNDLMPRVNSGDSWTASDIEVKGLEMNLSLRAPLSSEIAQIDTIEVEFRTQRVGKWC